MMKTDQQLIDEYLANGGNITKLPASEEKFEPIPNKLLIQTGQPIQYDNYGKRVYQHLNKTFYEIETDVTMLNYGE